MDNISKAQPVVIELSGETVGLDYNLASIHWLTTKHGDLGAFLKKASASGKKGFELLKPDFISALSDLIYAGLYVPNDDGDDISGWSPMKVMRSLHFNDLGMVSEAVGKAFDLGSPKAKPTPPEAVE